MLGTRITSGAPALGMSKGRTGAASVRPRLLAPRRNPTPAASGAFLGQRQMSSALATGMTLAPRESFSLAVFEFGAHSSSLSTRSAGRPAHLHGLLPPILSAHGYDLAHLLWYVYRDLFLLSRCLLSGCTHRRYDHNDRDRG